MRYQFQEQSVKDKFIRRSGSVAASVVLLITSQLAPLALAEDQLCRSKIDVNCDWIIDGQDLSMLLGGWGSGSHALDFDNDCVVGGGDIAIMLGHWGALPDVPELAPVALSKEIAGVCVDGDKLDGVVSGELALEPDQASYNGWVTVDLGDSVFVSMAFSDGRAVLQTHGTTVSIAGEDPEAKMQVNDEWVLVGDALDGVYADLSRDRHSPATWSGTTQALMGLGILHSTEACSQNVMAQQAANVSYGFWCKLAAIAAGALITSLLTAACLKLAEICAIGMYIFIGGFLIPCVALISLCAGGVFAGGVAAYELVLRYWGA